MLNVQEWIEIIENTIHLQRVSVLTFFEGNRLFSCLINELQNVFIREEEWNWELLEKNTCAFFIPVTIISCLQGLQNIYKLA